MAFSQEFLERYAKKRIEAKERWRNEAERTVDQMFDFCLAETFTQMQQQQQQSVHPNFTRTLESSLDVALKTTLSMGMQQMSQNTAMFPQSQSQHYQAYQGNQAVQYGHTPYGAQQGWPQQAPGALMQQPMIQPLQQQQYDSSAYYPQQQTNSSYQGVTSQNYAPRSADEQIGWTSSGGNTNKKRSTDERPYYSSGKIKKPAPPDFERSSHSDYDGRAHRRSSSNFQPKQKYSNSDRRQSNRQSRDEEYDQSGNYPKGNARSSEPPASAESNRLVKRIFRPSPPRDGSPSSSRSSSPDPMFIDQYTVLSLYCSECNDKFWGSKSLNDHLVSKHRIYFYKCPLPKCSQSYDDKVELESHQKNVHRNVREWRCYACAFVGQSSEKLSEHIDDEHQEGEFKCTKEDCEHISRTRAEAVTHFYGKQHGKKQDSASRETLGGSRDSPSYLKWTVDPSGSSERNNKKKDAYVTVTVMCLQENCTEFFFEDEELDQHMREVHSLMPLVCPIVGCPKSFETRKYFNEHARADHSEQEQNKSWDCPKCGRVVDDFEKLYTHVRLYHQEGQYRCIACDKLAKYRFEIIDHYDRDHEDF